MNLIKLLQLFLLAIFLGQMVFISYFLPQMAFEGGDFPEDIKMSFVLAGISIGLLWVIKKLTYKPEPQPEEEEEKEPLL